MQPGETVTLARSGIQATVKSVDGNTVVTQRWYDNQQVEETSDIADVIAAFDPNSVNKTSIQCPNCYSTVQIEHVMGQVSGFCPRCGDMIEMQVEA